MTVRRMEVYGNVGQNKWEISVPPGHMVAPVQKEILHRAVAVFPFPAEM